MTEPLPLTLKWRRFDPHLENYQAFDLDRCGEAKVAYIYQAKDSLGCPIPDGWLWVLCAPMAIPKTQGPERTAREAAYAAEEAYVRHLETVDPEAFRRDLQSALRVIENARSGPTKDFWNPNP